MLVLMIGLSSWSVVLIYKSDHKNSLEIHCAILGGLGLSNCACVQQLDQLYPVNKFADFHERGSQV